MLSNMEPKIKTIRLTSLDLPHRMQVEFAFYCANNVRDLASPEAIICLNLVAQWLKVESSVTKRELMSAADACAYLPDPDSVNPLACAAAICAARAVCYTSSPYHYARQAALYAVETGRKSADYYYNHLVKMVNDLTELERLLYNIKEGDL